MMRARPALHRRAIRIAVLLAVSIILAGLVTAPAGGQGPDYTFSGFRVIHEADGSLRLAYAVGWTGPAFPGIKHCTFRVFGEDGSLLAAQTIQLMSASRQPQPAEISMPPAAGGARPGRADADCEPYRLDDPAGRYELTNVTIERRTDYPEADRAFLLKFDDVWDGAGLPSTANCAATVRAAGGNQLFVYDFSFMDASAADSHEQTVAILLDHAVNDEPASAGLDCAPL